MQECDHAGAALASRAWHGRRTARHRRRGRHGDSAGAARRCAGSGADDGIRTRDPHLGKVMRYQLRYVRVCSVSAAFLLW